MKTINHIIREVPASQTDFSFYFEDDGLSERGGDFCYTLFIDQCDDRYKGFNMDVYSKWVNTAEEISTAFCDIADKYEYRDYDTYKDCMIKHGIQYNPRKCHALKKLMENFDSQDNDCIAAFLSIVTGKEWERECVCGYCQGDYVEVIYCVEHYKNAGVYGEVWLGCAKEFCVIDIENYQEDEDGECTYEEVDHCYGYIVADSEAWRDEDYKRIVSEWACIEEDETILEMIDSESHYTSYSYRTA